MKKLLTIGLLAFAFQGFAQTQNTWTKKLAFEGQKRARAIAFAIDDFGYVGMGEDTAEMTHNDLWKYDPVLDTWTQVASLPGSTRRNAVGITINGKGYVGTGVDSSWSQVGTILEDWWEYDAGLNSWTQKANYPGGYDALNNTGFEGVYFATAFEANGKGYICGGKMGPDFYGTDLWEYDPLLDSWTRKADFPGLDRYQMTSVSIDGKGYVGMGVDHDLFRKDWYEYDPLTDTWTQKTDLPGVERGASSSFVLGQRGFIVFGSDGGYKDELWQYDPYGDSWSIKSDFPGAGRKNGIAFAIGLKGYAGLGQGASGKRRSFYEYFPHHPLDLEEYSLNLNAYPNPAQNEFTLELDEYNMDIQLVIADLSGRILQTEQLNSSVTTIDVTELESGQYLILANDLQGYNLHSIKLNIVK